MTNALVWEIANIFKLAELNDTKQPQRDSNPQSSDSKSDALSIRPRSLRHTILYDIKQMLPSNNRQ